MPKITNTLERISESERTRAAVVKELEGLAAALKADSEANATDWADWDYSAVMDNAVQQVTDRVEAIKNGAGL